MDWEHSNSSLLAEFLESAKQRMARIGMLLDQLAHASVPSAILLELRSMFHNLAGISGACGFPLVSRRSRSGEILCLRIHRQLRPPLAVELKSLLETAAVITQCLAVADENDGRRDSAPARSKPHPSVYVLERSAELRDSWIECMEAEGFVASGMGTVEDLVIACALEPADAIVAEAGPLLRAGLAALWPSAATEPRRRIMILVGSDDSIAERLQSMRFGADAYFQRSTPMSRVASRLHRLLQVAGHQVASILVVDDDPIQTAWLRAILEPVGYFVHSCLDPQHFEQELCAARPDLLVLDHSLTGEVTGSALARFIRQHELYRALPMILLSGGKPGDGGRRSSFGGGLHLQKPVAPDLLRQAVAGCLSSRGHCVQTDRATLRTRRAG